MLRHDRFSLSRSVRVAASVALLAATFASSAAFASPSAVASVGIASDPANGNILADDRGMTLYRFTQDQPNTSTCYTGCASAWPPVVVDAIPNADPSIVAGLGTAPRTDGTQQLTYQGAPLYYYVGDTKPHDANGQASDGVWFVVNP